MEYTPQQLKAAYALNLCTVSISQIIDYDDVNIMEQEYEAILNNLNLEQIPKDEALLSILKQIMDTITFFRIQEQDKRFLEKEYQQRMKNAIWSAVPNIGLLVAGGTLITMAVSLASQVGIGYMNYRKTRASAGYEQEKRKWELERTAIEQFNGLRRELFDTAWRLSAAYNFPDRLRLTERQIKQYNTILMDSDLIRKYDRMTSIKDSFVAYPPFWYYYGNTANAISCSDLPLSGSTREQYRLAAKEHFIQYRNTNQSGLLREDPISASCALELLDLLDCKSDEDMIRELLHEAIAYSGGANDVLQLAAVGYLKLNDHGNAAVLLKQLVNEQYNTTLNAQLLSNIYVKMYTKDRSDTVKGQYEILKAQVGGSYLYPMPRSGSTSMEEVEERFTELQKQVLRKKYDLTMKAFVEKYLVRFGKLIPVAENRGDMGEAYFLGSDYAIELRKHEFAKVFSSPRKASEYIPLLQEVNIPYAILDLLNDLFNSCCLLDLMTEAVQAKLSAHIEKAIVASKDRLNALNKRIQDGSVDYLDMEKLLDIRLTDFTSDFFQDLLRTIDTYISSRTEMQDFAIAEENLADFCAKNGLPDPSALFGKDGNELSAAPEIAGPRFGIGLLEDKAVTPDDEITEEQKMLSVIRRAIPRIVQSWDNIEFFTNEDPRKEGYFRCSEKLRSNSRLMAGTLAVLDDRSRKGDYDLLFTVQGIVPIKGGIVKNPVSYGDVAFQQGKTPALVIDGRFENPAVDPGELFRMTQELKEYAKPFPPAFSSSRFPNFKNPFMKK